MMQRTKLPKKWKGHVHIATKVIRANPWQPDIKKKNNTGRTQRTIITNGNDNLTTIVQGNLYEEDRGTVLCLLELSNQTEKRFDFHIRDIAKIKKVKNPSAYSVQAAIWESLDRLLEARIRIRSKPNGKKALSASFVFVQGWINEDGYGNMSISPYLDVIRDLALENEQTPIKLDSYFSLRSQIARSLYSLLVSHESFYKHDGYFISLAKLCKSLNYDKGERYWSNVWPHIENALKQLKENGIVGGWKREKNRMKNDGGVLTIWKPHKVKQISTKPTSDKFKYSGLIKDIRIRLDEEGIYWTESWEKGLDKMLAILDGYLDDTGIALEPGGGFHSSWEIKTFVERFMDYLHSHGPYKAGRRYKYFSPALFDYKKDNGYIHQFIKKCIDEHEMRDLETMKSIKDSQEEKNRNARKRKAREEKLKKERDKIKEKGDCPLQDDADLGVSYEACKMKDECDRANTFVYIECSEQHRYMEESGGELF